MRLCFIGHLLIENRHGLIVDGRATRHPGYAASQRLRKRIEAPFGWTTAAAGLRRPAIAAWAVPSR